MLEAPYYGDTVFWRHNMLKAHYFKDNIMEAHVGVTIFWRHSILETQHAEGTVF